MLGTHRFFAPGLFTDELPVDFVIWLIAYNFI